MFKTIVFKKIKNHSNHQALALLDFACAEYSSAIEMLQAAKLSKNTKLTKGFINHSLDEYKHTSFFLNCLKTTLNNQKFDVHIKFNSKNLYYLGFLSEKNFLFEKFSLFKFSSFVAINEKQALNLFKKIKKSNFLKDISNLKKLDKIIEDEKKHLNEFDDNDFILEYEDLIFDEEKHVRLSTEFSKKYLNHFKRQFWNFSFLISNKFRHFVSKNKFLNNGFNFIISIIIIFLSFPLKKALRINKKNDNKINFSIDKSRLIL